MTSTSDLEGTANPAFKKDIDSDSWPEDERAPGSADAIAVAVEMDEHATPSAPNEGGDPDKIERQGTETENKRYSAQEEKILEVLRDVVRKCTNQDPMKRPSAAEVLDMLNKCPVNVK